MQLVFQIQILNNYVMRLFLSTPTSLPGTKSNSTSAFQILAQE